MGVATGSTCEGRVTPESDCREEAFLSIGGFPGMVIDGLEEGVPSIVDSGGLIVLREALNLDGVGSSNPALDPGRLPALLPARLPALEEDLAEPSEL